MFSNADFSEVQVFSLRHHGGGLALSDHFILKEFACSDGSDIVLVHPLLVVLLEEIRREAGTVLRINSAYRSHLYNKSIGGKSKSVHLWGMAADIVSPTVPPSGIASICDDLDIGGLGVYSNFVHADIFGSFRRW